MLIYGMNFLKGINIFSPNKKIYAVYNNVEGLYPSNPVMVNGYHIGLVEDIKFLPDKNGKVLITITITNHDIRVPRNSIARITSDFFGNRAIQIDLGKDSIRTLRHDTALVKNNDTLASASETTLKDQVSAQVLPLKNKAEELMVAIDSTMGIIKGVFTKKTQVNLTESIESISITLKHIQSISGNMDDLVGSQKDRLGDIFGKIDDIATAIAKNSKQLDRAINNMSNITDTLAKAKLSETIANADSTMYYTAQIFKNIDKGKGTLGQIATDTTLYRKLTGALNSLSDLTTDLKAHPRRYFAPFGKKN